MQIKTDWLIEVGKYIKDQSLDGLRLEVYPGIFYDPIPLNPETPKGKLRRYTPVKSGCTFTKKSLTNENILSALQYGVQSPCIDIFHESSLSELFRNVELDYIIPVFKLDKGVPTDILVNLIGQSTVICNKKINHKTMQLYASTQKDKIEELKEIVDQLQTSELTSLLAVEINISHLFYLEIARIRAMSIVIQNIYKHRGVELQTLEIIAKLDESLWKDDHQYGLIRQTAAYMSAIIGGATIVVPMPWDQDYRPESIQSLHIGNVLMLESKLHEQEDIMGGSYFIEDLTKQVAERIVRS